MLALLTRKPLFVRHCGNWFVRQTLAEHFWPWCMQRYGGGRNVMLATGGAATPPSPRNATNRWIFSTSLTERELMLCRSARPVPSPGAVRLIIVCRQDEAKGVGVVIESLPAILAIIPGATLDVVGDGPDLPVFTRIAERLGVSRHVTFHGKVNHQGVIRLLRSADLFCYPTWASEGFPKAVLEALACGLPVISTRVSVLPELIGAGGGQLIDEPSAAALSAAVLDCVADPSRFERMRVQGVETARRYSLERWRDTLGEWLGEAWGPLQSRA